MKLNKKFLSLLLAFAMIFSCFADIIPVAASSLPKEKTEELKGVKKGNKLEFAFEIPQNKSTRERAYTTDGGLEVSDYDFEAQGAGQNDTEIELITKGLNGAEFDWSALPGSEFKLIAKWNTTDGQSHEKPIGPITKDGVREFNVDWPVDGTLKGNAVLQSEYDQNIGIRVQFTPANSQGYGGKFKFKVTLEELAESRVDVKYVDPYGRELTDKADFPTGTMPKITAEELEDVSIDLPKTSSQINMREDKDNLDLDNLNSAASGLTYKVGGQGDEGTVTIGGKDYKLDISQPNAKDIATILLAYQKDVVIPPTKDDGSGKPKDVADGYVRLTFNADEKSPSTQKGRFDDLGTKTKYIDVKEGINYDNKKLQDIIAGFNPVALTAEGEVSDTLVFETWDPTVPNAATTKVTTQKYNAKYTDKYTKDNIIPYLPDDPVPTKGSDDKTIPKNFIDVVFKSEDIKKGKVKVGQKQGAEVKAKVRPNTDLSKSREITTVPNEHYGFTVWEPELTTITSTSAKEFTAKFVKSGDKIGPNDPIPQNWLKVTVKQDDESIKVNTVTESVYTVAPNDKLTTQGAFPDLTGKEEQGYKNPAWYKDDDKTATPDPTKVAITTNTTFTAKAEAQSTADKVKALGGLKGVDFAVWKDTSTAGKFWNKGIAPADGVQEKDKKTVQDAIDAATVTDTTTPGRTTGTKGEYPGTLKVKFADGSVYVVNEQGTTEAEKTNIAQTLYVYDKGDQKPDPKQPGGETPPVPEETIFVEFTRDEDSIKKDGFENLKPLMYAAGDNVAEDKFPAAKAADGYNQATVKWTPAKENATVDTTNTQAYNAQTKTFTFKASATNNVPTTKNSDDYDPHYTGKSGKPGETVQIDAPKFTKKGVTGNVQAPTGTKFANNDPNQTSVTVDPDTGAIKVVIPQDAPVGSTITIAVDVTYPDNSNETVEVTVTVSDNTQPKPEEDKSKTPIVDPVNDGDTSISGKGEPGSDIIINIPGKDPIKTTVDEGGKWIAPIDPAHEGDVIKVVQIEVGKKPSDPAYVTVGGRSIIVPSHDDGGYWWFGGGSFKPVETEEQVIDKTEHGIHIAYIFGYKDHTFRCEGKITRAEAASMIAHIAKLDLSDNSKPDFKDTPSSWYNAAINAMVKKNLMFADKNGNFRPNEPITRGEFARAIQFIDKENKKEAPFMDIKGHEFEEAINQAYANGRISGYPDGTFKPDESITRAEAVTILNNFDGRMVRERGIEDVKKDLIKFTDLKPSHWAYYEIIEASNSHAYSRISNDSKEEKWSNLIK